MCVYGRVVFQCAHERWGICVKRCQTAKDFHDGKLNHDCVMKKPHVPTSRRVQTDCNKCTTMNGKLVRARKSIDDVKQKLKRIEERKIRERKIDNRKTEKSNIEKRDSNETDSSGFGTGLGSITEESEDEDKSTNDGTSQSGSQVSKTSRSA